MFDCSYMTNSVLCGRSTRGLTGTRKLFLLSTTRFYVLFRSSSSDDTSDSTADTGQNFKSRSNPPRTQHEIPPQGKSLLLMVEEAKAIGMPSNPDT